MEDVSSLPARERHQARQRQLALTYPRPKTVIRAMWRRSLFRPDWLLERAFQPKVTRVRNMRYRWSKSGICSCRFRIDVRIIADMR